MVFSPRSPKINFHVFFRTLNELKRERGSKIHHFSDILPIGRHLRALKTDPRNPSLPRGRASKSRVFMEGRFLDFLRLFEKFRTHTHRYLTQIYISDTSHRYRRYFSQILITDISHRYFSQILRTDTSHRYIIYFTDTSHSYLSYIYIYH